ncbi:leucine-rich repeat-containing protein 45-like isoform X2 [Centruroides sculpturatus]|uniref:leucine-rich repeat-containing protein 45-like isoform X1 n=3 Tax=Centruroides sculpturatus TaxID=218467 RepID=UPI000C6EC137|nr:leucine-rich repeat-containing protein 45-like isoform X1 [Centruroides sculpturatus]XP_023217977.1 leucine-rich repeat-containing protein 45-like isoform X1 [Centruroides sculpturatus]XP_023217978.1 leucine-rich repeat-containing protein 45-like isoform X2 [Centruroides sculpturatus]
MEAFKETYKKLCRKYEIEPQDLILGYLKGIGDERISLDLSTCALSASTCFILGKILENDLSVTDLCFCNCMLQCKGIKAILDGLCLNGAVQHLHLKGNGLKGANAEDIGKLLTYNKVLHQLSLEWNSLGKSQDAFTLFCSGLAVNKTLKVLDLRSNLINNEGAIALAGALSKNEGLKSIDLRWNLVGQLGACALLNVLKKHNKSLIHLDLTGNPEISEEVLQAIAAALNNNCTMQLLQEEQITRTKQITNEMQTTKDYQLEQQTLPSYTQELFQESGDKIGNIKDLANELKEKKIAFDAMVERVNKLQNDLEVIHEQNKEANKLLAQYKAENEELKNQQQKLLIKENKDRLDAEANIVAEIDAIKEEKRSLELQLECALKTHEIHTSKIEKLQTSIASLEIQLKHSEVIHAEEINAIKQEQNEAIKEVEQSKQDEIANAKKGIEEIEQKLNENLQRLEMQRTQLEKEIMHLNGKLVEERTKTEELLQQQRLKFHEEMEAQCSQLSEKVHTLQKENDDQIKVISQKEFDITQLQSVKEHLEIEKENLHKIVSQLKEQLASKESELRNIVTTSETENRDKHNELMKEKDNNNNLQSKVLELETTLNNLQNQYSENIANKDYQINTLKDILQKKETELQNKQQEELNRASELYSAFKNYMDNVPRLDITSYFASRGSTSTPFSKK